MKMKLIFILSVIYGLLFVIQQTDGQFLKPEQMHISYGEDPSKMFVTWSTMNKSMTATCMYGIHDIGESKATGFSNMFKQSPSSTHFQYIHKVRLTGLKPKTLYKYSCGSGRSADEMSQVFSFWSMNTDLDFGPSFAMFGDMGSVNARSLTRMQNDVDRGMYDAILHVGDFAYDMDTNDGKNGDQFLRNVEPIAATTPYMTCPGNHENRYNFTNYKHRFTMPTDENGDRMFYSVDIGPVHLISLSTEYFFFVNYGLVQIPNQFHWLEQDIKAANNNRDKVPWIITMGHRPMYCSNNDGDDCTKFISVVRAGIPFFHWWDMERLFYEQGVDLTLWAHEHSYERLWPIYNQKVFNGTKGPYINPGAPVHIITGSAGCSEGHDRFKNGTASWSAFHSDDYGFTRMKVFNKTHLYMEQVSDDKGGAIIDKMWLIQEKHGPRK